MQFLLGPRRPAIEFLREIPQHFAILNGYIVVAWARRSGVDLLYSALRHHLRHVTLIVGTSARGTTAEALAHLRLLCHAVYVYHAHPRHTFHPKLYLLDSGGPRPQSATALIGSSNLTAGGLLQNIEANLTLQLHPASSPPDLSLYNSVVQDVAALLHSSSCHKLATDTDIRHLLRDRYIVTESDLLHTSSGTHTAVPAPYPHHAPTPPPLLPARTLPPLHIRFRPIGPAVPSRRNFQVGQFYVRTLTENDIRKLRGVTPGTAEWDIGETARDHNPEFWGWPRLYQPVTRNTTRREWRTTGVLWSALTAPTGTDIDIILWYRQPRTGHAAEHRLRIGPRPTLTVATPPHFDTSSLVVLARPSDDRSHTFLVRLLTSRDPEYDAYRWYLQHDRPRHRYGYGP